MSIVWCLFLLETSKKCVISSHDNLPRFPFERNFIFMSSLLHVTGIENLRKSEIDTFVILLLLSRLVRSGSESRGEVKWILHCYLRSCLETIGSWQGEMCCTWLCEGRSIEWRLASRLGTSDSYVVKCSNHLRHFQISTTFRFPIFKIYI